MDEEFGRKLSQNFSENKKLFWKEVKNVSVAALILAVSRAIGETMVVLLAAGAANASQFTTNPLERGLTMTAAIASQIRGTEQARGEGLILESLYFVGFLLFVITLVLNLVADRFVRRVRQQY